MLAHNHAKLDKIIVFKPELLMNLFSLLNKHHVSLLQKSNTLLILLSFLCTPFVFATEIRLSDLPGWQQDNLNDAWNSWQQSCIAFDKKDLSNWQQLCTRSDSINPDNTQAIRDFFESSFKITAITNSSGTSEGTITGYYEPVLSGSLSADDEFRFPIFTKPLSNEMGSLTRKQIEQDPNQLKQSVIAWTNDPHDLFFLHVQGSGRIQLKNGTQQSLVYAGNNGHDYTSIGKVLINQGLMEKEKISMQTLKQWLQSNPQKAAEIMQHNKRYIYFNLVQTPEHESGPRGSLNVPLTPSRSIAIDPSKITLGSPVWLDTTLPVKEDEELFQRLMFAQDTGAAIKGHVRADVFFGQGKEAEFLAGHMNQLGKMYVLVPR